MHLPQHPITGIEIAHDHPKRIQIHDGMETLLFVSHLVVDGIEIFFSAQYTGLNASIFKSPFDFRMDFLNHLFAVSPSLRNHFFEHAIAIGVEGFKAQLFELDFYIMDT